MQGIHPSSSIIALVRPVAVVHEHLQERTGEQQYLRTDTEHVRSGFGQQKERRDAQEHEQNGAAPRRPEAATVGPTLRLHLAFLFRLTSEAKNCCRTSAGSRQRDGCNDQPAENRAGERG
jgi:hypothetical protein